MIRGRTTGLAGVVIFALAAVAHSQEIAATDAGARAGELFDLCPTPPVIASVIDSNDSTQPGRLVRNGVISECSSLKVCPGVTDGGTAYHYDAWNFFNNTGQGRCVTVTVEPTSCPGQVFSAVYTGGYFPNNPCFGYVGDQGVAGSDKGVSYSVFISSGTFFTVAVSEVTPGVGCAGYKLSVVTNSCNGFPLFVTKKFDNFQTSTGWSQLGTTTAEQGTSFSEANTALLAQITPSASNWRTIGWITNSNNTLAYSNVTSMSVVRCKFSMYATGQGSPALNQIPNFRMRIANRFAVTSQLIVNNHLNSDPEATALGQDIRPSTSPASPSTYRVDLDPLDVPFLVQNPITEGFLAAFEVYEPDPQANGTIALATREIGVYPKLENYSLLTAIAPNQTGLLKRYLPAVGGGDFGTGNIASSNSSAMTAKYHNGVLEPVGPQPGISVNISGVTLQTLNVESDRLGLAAFDVFNDTGDQTDHTKRARFETNKQYKFRFHATSTQNSNVQALVRFRARTLKFMYTASLEVGGATGASVNSNTIATQALPGVGNQIPNYERLNPGEQGGWYSVIMLSPLDPSIRSNQPNLLAQDGPGVDTQPVGNTKSRRDLQFGFDIIDTFSTNPTSGLERGHMTVDRVEIMGYNFIED